MAIILNDNIDTRAPKPTDNRFGPFTTTAAALANIPEYQRYVGLTVGVGTPIVEYWFDSTLALVLKTSSGTVTGITAGTGINIGGTAEAPIISVTSPTQLTTNLSTNVITDGASDTKYPSVKATKAYVDSNVAGLLDDRGNFPATSGDYPIAGGSGPAGAIRKGDLWFISVPGNLNGIAVGIGASVRALVDDAQPTTNADWDILDTGLGFIPENVANKVIRGTSIAAAPTSETQYASLSALTEYLASIPPSTPTLEQVLAATPTQTAEGYDINLESLDGNLTTNVGRGEFNVTNVSAGTSVTVLNDAISIASINDEVFITSDTIEFNNNTLGTLILNAVQNNNTVTLPNQTATLIASVNSSIFADASTGDITIPLIGSTGTENFIPKWSSSSSLGDSIIQQVGTNNIQIGSSSLAGLTLDLFSSDRVDFRMYPYSTTTDYFGIYSYGPTGYGSSYTQIGLNDGITLNQQGAALYLDTRASLPPLSLMVKDATTNVMTNALSVATNGNVGIGTTTPTTGLHLKNKVLTIDGSQPTSGINFVYSNSGANHLIAVNSSDLAFYTTSQTVNDLRRTIQIANGFSTVNTVPFLNLRESTGQIPTWIINPNEAGTLPYAGLLNLRVANAPGGYIQSYNLASYDAADTLVSYVKPNGDGYYSGSVGIGTTTPGYKLDVNGTGRFVNDLYADEDLIINNYFTINTTATSLPLPNTLPGIWRRAENSYGTKFLEDEQGGAKDKWAFVKRIGYNETREWFNTNSSTVNINLGWQNPNESNLEAATLLIDPKINITATLPSPTVGTVIRGIYYNPNVVSDINLTHIGFENTKGNNFLNSTSGFTAIKHPSTYTNPYQFDLDVNGKARIGNLSITTSTNAGDISGSGIKVTGMDATFQFQGSAANGITMFSFSPWNSNTTKTSLTNIDAGIIKVNGGFQTPNLPNLSGNTLWLTPSYDFPVTIPPSPIGTKVRGIYYDPSVGDMINTTHIAFENTSGDVLLNTTSGRVGIGISTPEAKLDVNGWINAKSGLVLNGSGFVNGVPASGGKITFENATIKYSPEGGQGFKHNFFLNGSSRLWIDDNGVGIQNTNPLYKLEVGGTATVPIYAANTGIVKINSGFTTPSAPDLSANVLWITPTYSFPITPLPPLTAVAGTVRGIYYDPSVGAMTNTKHIALETTHGNVFLNSTSGQTAIGTAAPSVTAKLQIDSTTQGFLPPRMTTAEMNAIVNPEEGLIVFNISVPTLVVYAGKAWNRILMTPF